MFRKAVVLTALFVLLLNGAACAQSAKTIAADMVYGALAGALLGAAVYVFDRDDLGDKLLYGAALGTLGGFAVGVIDAQNASIVEIEKGDVFVNAPRPVIKLKEDTLEKTSNLRYTVGILTYRH